MMRDMQSRLKPIPALSPVVRDADANGASIDRAGYQEVTFVVTVGVGGITFSGTNKLDLRMEHSDDGSAWSNVATADVLGGPAAGVSSGVVRSFTAAHAAEASYKFGYIGGKRYSRMVADFSGTHSTGTMIAATALLSRPAIEPVA